MQYALFQASTGGVLVDRIVSPLLTTAVGFSPGHRVLKRKGSPYTSHTPACRSETVPLVSDEYLPRGAGRCCGWGGVVGRNARDGGMCLVHRCVCSGSEHCAGGLLMLYDVKSLKAAILLLSTGVRW